jgi:hypothetical protein
LETLVTGPRFEQRAIDREVLIGEQAVLPDRGQNFGKERVGDVALEQTVAVFVNVVASRTGSSMLRPPNHR